MRILSLDGGGVRGLITARVLNNYERKFRIDFRDFDVFAGTSTGSIIAALLACDFSTDEIERFYLNHGSNIFKKKFLRFGLFRSKYDDTVFNELLIKYFKDITFGELRKKGVNLIIPAYNTSTMDRAVFRTSTEKYDSVLVRDAVRASASAPTYFDAHVIDGEPYIDGGLVMNNPSLVAIVDCINNSNKVTEILSVGTGRIEKPISKRQLGKGVLGNGADLFNLQLTEQAQTTEFFTNALQANLNYQYKRIEPVIKYSNGEIDDFSSRNICAMLKDADSTII
jgi:hypothetical protein